ncbi:hypothetical protein ACFYKX_05830 [Cytobacillus sp. FJAT-54145]|uniref:Uncharacterized protein n=1 Tax=Cytobacillus spartinae TaxID=3299023 RepID=A0ABW6KB46_9BACI
MNKFSKDDLLQRVEALERANEVIIRQIRSLQHEVVNIEQRAHTTINSEASTDNRKITYLTEANEQMFQQLIRLRQLIENCIESNEVPTHTQYYEALKGDI